MRMRYCLLAFCFVACSKDSSNTGTGSATPAPDPGPGTGSAPAITPAPAPGTVEIFVDDKSVAKVGKDQIAGWPKLDSLVPEEARRLGTWQTVYLRGSGAKPAELNRPSATYPELVGALFPGDDGKPSFGMFDPVELAKHGKPGLRQDDLKEIRIVRSKGERSGDHQGGGASEDPMKLVLKIQVGGKERDLTGEKILAIPRESMPGNPDTKGWPLTKLLAAAEVTKYSKLVLIDAAGTALTIEKKDFDDKTAIPFIKLNRQGSLRFRMLKKQGDGWQYAGDLRALSTIKVD
jgi:hypothetical protein